jgi:hypothetical protein
LRAGVVLLAAARAGGRGRDSVRPAWQLANARRARAAPPPFVFTRHTPASTRLGFPVSPLAPEAHARRGSPGARRGSPAGGQRLAELAASAPHRRVVLVAPWAVGTSPR